MALKITVKKKDRASSMQAYAIQNRLKELVQKHDQIGEVKYWMEHLIQYYPRKNNFSMDNLYRVVLIESPITLQIWKKPCATGAKDILLYEVTRD